MTSGHVFYIPILILVGLILGYYWGRSAEEREHSRHNERSRSEGESRRSRRRERRSDSD